MNDRLIHSKKLCALGAALLLAPLAALHADVAQQKPNIIYILADDIGYGDFGCYGATKVKTPNVDKLASLGLRFTDAHAMASVCTPSRYAFLTGEYAFRKKGTGIASGIDGLLIEPGRATVPSLLKRAGYTTGIVGKWHLGLGTKPTDYNSEIKPGPLEIGFDYAWIMPATGDRTPCVWVENHRVVGLDPADPIKLDYSVKRGEPRSFIHGIPRIGEQTGGKAALWDDENISTVIAAKSCAFIEQHASEPFFIEVATHNIHVPRVPNPKFRGASQCGVRGDTIAEFDWIVGQVLGTLERLKIAENTLVILTSDNGGVLDSNGPDKEHGGTVESNNGHLFNGMLRGVKGSIWEGGTRVPLVTRWPGHIQPGTSGALVCQVDMLSSFASLTGQRLDPADGPDSFNVLPALLGVTSDKPWREYLIEQDNSGNALALRKGPWKFIPGNGGKKGKAARRRAELENPAEKIADKDLPPITGQLYNLDTDLSETSNVAAAHPDIVTAMSEKLDEIKTKGRSRP